jgi:molybdopterin-guanine dinucleotide biosynthesis protein A
MEWSTILSGFRVPGEETEMTREAGRIVALATSTEKGTVKTRIPAARFIREHGIEGDAHAGPGPRQVSFLGASDIRAMEAALGQSLGFGRFGENVVVDGCDPRGIAAGDLLVLGESVVVEVMAMGKECHRGCEIRRLAGDCIMPRHGVFGRVALGGETREGAAFRVVSPASDFTVVVLAGGRSTRFGSDKRFAILGDGTLLSRAIETARQVTPNVILSVAPGDGAAFSGLARVVEDDLPGLGPLSGIVAALVAAETASCVFMPVDCPNVTPDLLRCLAALARGDGAVVEGPKGIEPLLACYRREALPGFRDALGRGKLPVRERTGLLNLTRVDGRVLSQLGVIESLLVNINSSP